MTLLPPQPFDLEYWTSGQPHYLSIDEPGSAINLCYRFCPVPRRGVDLTQRSWRHLHNSGSPFVRQAARRNVKHYQRADGFPVSMRAMYGDLRPAHKAPGTQFPRNVTFQHVSPAGSTEGARGVCVWGEGGREFRPCLVLVRSEDPRIVTRGVATKQCFCKLWFVSSHDSPRNMSSANFVL